MLGAYFIGAVLLADEAAPPPQVLLPLIPAAELRGILGTPVNWQLDVEGSTFAGAVGFKPYLATVRFHDVFDDSTMSLTIKRP